MSTRVVIFQQRYEDLVEAGRKELQAANVEGLYTNSVFW